MTGPFSIIAPSAAVRLIARLGPLRSIALRLYNRVLMTVAPHRRVTTVFGSSLQCDVRDMIQATLIHLGAWEPRSTQILATYLQPGDVVADVGANIGYYTLLFGQCVGDIGQVVSIEPLPSSGAKVKANIAANRAKNIRLAQVAASNERSKITLYEASHTNIGMATTLGSRGFDRGRIVEAAPLHDILADDERGRLALIKIDIEGAEPAVLADFLDHLSLYPGKPALAVEIDAGQAEWQSLFDRLIESGYRAFDLHNDYDWLRLVDRPDMAPTEISALPVSQSDVLFLPDTDRGQAFIERLASRAAGAT